jgi:hypothetical protein
MNATFAQHDIVLILDISYAHVVERHGKAESKPCRLTCTVNAKLNCNCQCVAARLLLLYT